MQLCSCDDAQANFTQTGFSALELKLYSYRTNYFAFTYILSS